MKVNKNVIYKIFANSMVEAMWKYCCILRTSYSSTEHMIHGKGKWWFIQKRGDKGTKRKTIFLRWSKGKKMRMINPWLK